MKKIEKLDMNQFLDGCYYPSNEQIYEKQCEIIQAVNELQGEEESKGKYLSIPFRGDSGDKRKWDVDGIEKVECGKCREKRLGEEKPEGFTTGELGIIYDVFDYCSLEADLGIKERRLVRKLSEMISEREDTNE